jgi:hypothetical protein
VAARRHAGAEVSGLDPALSARNVLAELGARAFRHRRQLQQHAAERRISGQENGQNKAATAAHVDHGTKRREIVSIS